MDSELTAEQAATKERFEDEVGYWLPAFDQLLRLDPAFFEVYAEWLSHPYETGALDRKTQELVLVAAYSQVTHLRPDGIRRHVRLAFEAGADLGEVLEVMEMASVLGMHSFMIGGEVLYEEVDDVDIPAAEVEAFLDDFEERRGYRPRPEVWTPYLAPDPEFFEKYVDYSAHPWSRGSLAPKVREFVYVAIDATPAHLLARGIRGHLDNALGYDASPAEIAEVLQLVSLLAVDTLAEGVPVLVEEAEAAGVLPD